MNDIVHILVRAVIIDQGHILLCRSRVGKHPFYFLPGGHIEPGESELEALRRELYEETGAHFVIGEKLGVIPYKFSPSPGQKYCHRSECNNIYKADSPAILISKPLVQREDHIQLMWVSLQRLQQIDLKPQALAELVG